MLHTARVPTSKRIGTTTCDDYNILVLLYAAAAAAPRGRLGGCSVSSLGEYIILLLHRL